MWVKSVRSAWQCVERWRGVDGGVSRLRFAVTRRRSLRPWVCALCLLGCVTVGFAGDQRVCDAAAPASISKNAMLWRLHKAGEATHYLLGTLHVDGPWVELMLEDLAFIQARTEQLFLELEMTGLTQLALAEHMLLPQPHSLTDYFSATEYEALKRLLWGRIDPDRLVAMKPWVAFAELYSIKADTARTMDALLAQYYAADDKPVAGLETVERQLSVFDQLTYTEQARLVKRALTLHAQQSQGLQERLFVHYKRGDLQNLWRLQGEFAQAMGPLFAPLHEATLAGRNEDMVVRFLAQKGSVASLIAVGALHLPGPRGLLCLFEQQGYQLTPLPMDPQGGFTDKPRPH